MEIIMGNVRILEVKQSIFESNDKQAALLREELKKDGVFLLNLMSSPGSGKTTTLTRTIEALKGDLKIGVMEADIDSDVDAETILKTGAKAIQLHTGGMCHLDADMTAQGLEGLETGDIDLAILENVGNLVCPAEFDTGAVKNAMNDAKGKCTCPSDLPYCVCGAKSLGKIITRKPIVATEEELEQNSRSKSAKLRIFERVY